MRPDAWLNRACDLTILGEKLRQRAARDDAELTERGVPRLCRLDQALGDEPAAVVIAAMWQLAARLLQDDIHVRFGSLTQLCHDARSVRVACKRKHTQKDVV
ncbi:hypothetical protein SAMN05216338_1001403 [Bradyrhizobium sp. Rc2d]|nr:hypothetical protein SAMN05216338_1001403 [Bradyrhizobium sp. Rc2d]